MTHPDHLLERAGSRLQHEREQVLALCDREADALLETPPGPGRWCVLEILQHVALTESAVIRMLSSPAPRGSTRLRGPALLRWIPVAWRLELLARGLGRARAPVSVRPAHTCARRAVLRQLDETRRATLEYLHTTNAASLLAVRRNHEVLGELNGIEWVDFIASHEHRHRLQIETLLLRSHAC